MSKLQSRRYVKILRECKEIEDEDTCTAGVYDCPDCEINMNPALDLDRDECYRCPKCELQIYPILDLEDSDESSRVPCQFVAVLLVLLVIFWRSF